MAQQQSGNTELVALMQTLQADVTRLKSELFGRPNIITWQLFAIFMVNKKTFMSANINPILLRYGGANKSSFSMNASELEQAAASILRRAKEKAFYKGLPVYFTENSNLIAEYADGRKEVLKKLNNVSSTVRHSRAQRHR